jgi:hypothetical protein
MVSGRVVGDAMKPGCCRIGNDAVVGSAPPRLKEDHGGEILRCNDRPSEPERVAEDGVGIPIE